MRPTLVNRGGGVLPPTHDLTPAVALDRSPLCLSLFFHLHLFCIIIYAAVSDRLVLCAHARVMAATAKPVPFHELKSPGAAGQKKFDFSQATPTPEDGHLRTRAYALSAQRACLLKELKGVVDGNTSAFSNSPPRPCRLPTHPPPPTPPLSKAEEVARRRAAAERLQGAVTSEPMPELRAAIASLQAALAFVANRQEFATREFVQKQAVVSMEKYDAIR